ncbi:MAG: metallophosphoesterase [Chryseosolibacter sp.]
MGRVFVIGDIHGAYRALRQCLERSAFDYRKDHLVCLGDVSDGWPETRACVDELLRMENLTYILGNHDWWTLEWMRDGRIEPIWYAQGGKATIDSYADGVPSEHISFFAEADLYYVFKNKLFVHAGINPLKSLEEQNEDIFLWDRSLASQALHQYGKAGEQKISSFEEIYIGHTPVPFPEPIFSAGVWMMDTGAGWSGVLSMMDIETKAMYISDAVPALYPGVEGRKRKI